MKDRFETIKQYVKKDPLTSAFIASVAIGTVLKAADQIAGIQSKRAYSKQVNRSLKNNR
jgi:predicted RND superfamily exporter protein